MGILIKTYFKSKNNIGKYSPITIDERLVPYALKTNLTNQSTADKLSAFVVAIDEGGILDKVQAFYPMFGDSFDKMSYNLLEPDKYQLTLKSGAGVNVTPDVGFVKSTGGIGYISTNFTFPQDQLNDYHLLYSSDGTINTSDLFVPIGVGAMGDGSLIILRWGEDMFFRNTLETASTYKYDNPNMLIMSNDGVIENYIYKDYETIVPMNNTRNGSYITLGGYNTTNSAPLPVGVETPPISHLSLVTPYVFAGMGKNLTKDELIIYSDALKLLDK